MFKIHKSSDLTQTFNFTDLKVSEVANVYFLLINPVGEVVKQVAIVADIGFPSEDVTVVDDETVEVRVHRSETANYQYGKYTFNLRVAYNNVDFAESVEIRSEAIPSFYVVANYEKTSACEDIDICFPIGVSNGIPPGGTTNQVLKKVSDDDYDVEWLNESGGGGGGHIIQDEGSDLTQRTNLNFVGDGVTVTDDSGNDATVVTIDAGGGAVDSVNGQVGTVVLDADDIDDTLTANKFVSQSERDKLSGIEDGAEVNPTDAEIKVSYENNADTNAFTDNDVIKLGGVESGAEVNNLTDTQANSLTSGTNSTDHYHEVDRDRANHTGTQTASTISDFQSEVSGNTDVSGNTTDRHTHTNKALLDTITDSGGGDNYLSDDGTYKPVGGGGAAFPQWKSNILTSWGGSNYAPDGTESDLQGRLIDNTTTTLNFIAPVNFPSDRNELVLRIDNSINTSAISTINFTGYTFPVGMQPSGIAIGSKARLIINNEYGDFVATWVTLD